jgi:hypothetical protein
VVRGGYRGSGRNARKSRAYRRTKGHVAAHKVTYRKWDRRSRGFLAAGAGFYAYGMCRSYHCHLRRR